MNVPLDDRANLPDVALLALYVQGDERAAVLLTERLLPRVFNHAFRMLGRRSEAEDVAQEAMMRLWRIAPDWREGEAQISTWLYRVTANLCIDQTRSRRGVALDDIAEPADPAPTAEQKIQDRARVDALQLALDQLPERQRQAVVLRHIEGLPNPEIGRIMELNIRAVESLTARGKRTLADLLAGRRAELGYQDDEA